MQLGLWLFVRRTGDFVQLQANGDHHLVDESDSLVARAHNFSNRGQIGRKEQRPGALRDHRHRQGPQEAVGRETAQNR